VRTALLVAATAAVACCAPRAARAGRSFYGWLYGTEVLPERGVELQTWILEQNDKYGSRAKETSIWWGPLIGITDQLELGLPIELEWLGFDDGRTSFTFRRFGAELRYRWVPQDSVDAPSFVPLIRVAIKRDVAVRDDVRVEGDAVASYEIGPAHALIDLGWISDITPHNRHSEMRPGGGISFRVTPELRVGAEIYSEFSLDSLGESWAMAGPDLAWSHGRFWLSGAVGIGLYHVKLAPRIMWGIAF
jgi:hypothetical protein